MAMEGTWLSPVNAERVLTSKAVSRCATRTPGGVSAKLEAYLGKFI